MERRRTPRREVASAEPLAAARLRTGGPLLVVNASSYGVLAETTERLLPGRHLDVHVVSSEGRLLVRSRVARTFVCHVSADIIRYRAALAFDRALDVRLEGYVVPALPPEVIVVSGKSYPERAGTSDIEFAERLTA